MWFEMINVRKKNDSHQQLIWIMKLQAMFVDENRALAGMAVQLS